MNSDEVEFPTAVCPDHEAGKVHGPHRIAGTWREDCPGVPAIRGPMSPVLRSAPLAVDVVDPIEDTREERM